MLRSIRKMRAARGIESGDKVLVYSDRVPVHKDTIQGVGGKDFQFSELMKNGHIDLIEGAFEAVALVTNVVKKGVLYSDALNTEQPSNAVQARVVDNISGNYNYKLGSARIKKIGESEFKHEFQHMSFVHEIS